MQEQERAHCLCLPINPSSNHLSPNVCLHQKRQDKPHWQGLDWTTLLCACPEGKGSSFPHQITVLPPLEILLTCSLLSLPTGNTVLITWKGPALVALGFWNVPEAHSLSATATYELDPSTNLQDWHLRARRAHNPQEGNHGRIFQTILTLGLRLTKSDHTSYERNSSG